MIHSPSVPPFIFVLVFIAIFANFLKVMFHFEYLQKYYNRFKNITFLELAFSFNALSFENFYDYMVIGFPFPAARLQDGAATMESEKLRKKIKFLVILIWIIVPIIFYYGIASFGDFGR